MGADEVPRWREAVGGEERAGDHPRCAHPRQATQADHAADGILSITGKIEGDTEGADYLDKGIADRAFTRKFVLADTMEIKNAELINGMLKVYLENLIPESKKPRKVSINDEPSVVDPVSTVASWFTPKEKEVA